MLKNCVGLMMVFWLYGNLYPANEEKIINNGKLLLISTPTLVSHDTVCESEQILEKIRVQFKEFSPRAIRNSPYRDIFEPDNKRSFIALFNYLIRNEDFEKNINDLEVILKNDTLNININENLIMDLYNPIEYSIQVIPNFILFKFLIDNGAILTDKHLKMINNKQKFLAEKMINIDEKIYTNQLIQLELMYEFLKNRKLQNSKI